LFPKITADPAIHTRGDNNMARKITELVCASFESGHDRKINNTESRDRALYLHGNKIAEYRQYDTGGDGRALESASR